MLDSCAHTNGLINVLYKAFDTFNTFNVKLKITHFDEHAVSFVIPQIATEQMSVCDSAHNSW